MVIFFNFQELGQDFLRPQLSLSLHQQLIRPFVSSLIFIIIFHLLYGSINFSRVVSRGSNVFLCDIRYPIFNSVVLIVCIAQGVCLNHKRVL